MHVAYGTVSIHHHTAMRNLFYLSADILIKWILTIIPCKTSSVKPHSIGIESWDC